MPRRNWVLALCLWPGLPQIWTGQDALGLMLAALFAVTLNLALVTRYIWTDMLGPGMSPFVVALAACTWLAALVYTLWWVWRCHPTRFQETIDQYYREAIEAYLQGRWNDARRRLEQILAIDDSDADALMQLGSLYARTDQAEQARRTFRQCLDLEGGSKWRWEIERALILMQSRRDRGSAAASPAPSRGDESAQPGSAG